MVNVLEKTFPGLASGGYTITSPRATRYNCIAWAAGDSGKWWWPGQNVEEEFWPPTVARAEALDAFQQAFASLFVENGGATHGAVEDIEDEASGVEA